MLGCGYWLDPIATACGVVAALLATVPYWSHLADVLAGAAEERWRSRYQGSLRASADAMARESREGALLLAGRAENLAITFHKEAERLVKDAGGAMALADERARELAEARRRLARPKVRKAGIASRPLDPALAGNTMSDGATAIRGTVHPRVGGEASS